MEVKRVRVNLIDPNPMQVRQKFDEEKLKELSESIKEVDILSLPIVQKKGARYQLIAGERRWRAAIKAGLTEILTVIRYELTEFESLLISGSENIQREDLTSIERENLVYDLWIKGLEEGKIKTHEDLKNKIGLSRKSITNIISSKEFREKHMLAASISTRSIIDTIGLSENERIKLLKRLDMGGINPAEIREYTSTIKTASEPIKEILLEVGSQITLKEAITIDSELETVKEKKRALEILRGEKEQRLDIVLEIAKDRPRVPIMLDEIDTGYLWKCPICGENLHLIHVSGDKMHKHKFERVVE